MQKRRERWFENVDRRVIYLLVALALAVPLIRGVALRPAEMATATTFFSTIEALQPESGKVVFAALDFGPSTQAENRAQAAVALEHLMRKRIPFAVLSISFESKPFLEEIPRQIAAKLTEEDPSHRYTYGVDWVNLGYQPNAVTVIQGLAKTSDIHTVIKSDVFGTPLEKIPAMKEVRTLKQISMLMEFTGLSGALQLWMQFLQNDEYRPPIVHGCTSITIPEAYIFFSSKQILGLHEGIAGAAWYEVLLSERYPNRKSGQAIVTNSSLAIAQLVLLGLIFVGNIGAVLHKR